MSVSYQEVKKSMNKNNPFSTKEILIRNTPKKIMVD